MGVLFEYCADVDCSNIFAWLNQGPLTLTIFLHTVIILPMFWIDFQEKRNSSAERSDHLTQIIFLKVFF